MVIMNNGGDYPSKLLADQVGDPTLKINLITCGGG